ncbi:sugar ABC transporter ATP-binding protein [Bariatricus massiliensis]|uniref:Sugar ABC transporter ATP-binding protein n=1 Tax=Bariatricus massiliensis TaxID=1745713 RepID=A0ABS8DKQ2_9FIRM|nr:sugar ABC transporter ATP-binding protein [Bariatricus massiliensis]MCB7305889.1 sugar ABC transporter ATP-binding protein [Bariatricus massiliensis]MCB7376521.1 sugar ABC transporter ATP-binding protein [Bariatricus massiliensis]MCB7389032.1 sugar ABC transporter ATP-binding protein [Bariatricus massiliensis]MCB7413205.1 sugar ABC transporter ATP-binding protein [Bariatricus massiliensis]MCQ5255101.1 sugar ABC transporter ATP-binding protein [Bariatricus massiliensis]
MQPQYKIELRNITKDFSGVRALNNVSIKIRPGTVHTLVGENGAGKSTLMKVLNGIYKPDGGSIIIDGKETVIKNPIDAREQGIAMIFQELNYIPELSIEENIFMGKFPNGKMKGLVNWREVRQRTKELLKNEGLNYEPQTKIKNLSVSEIQMLEIIKAISFNASVVIMDEPTSAITTKEVELLFRKIEDMKKRGISVVYISHKMDEIFRISDDITVLRDGEVVGGGPASDYDDNSLIAQMVGREISNLYPKETVPIGETVLEVKDLCSEGMFEHIDMTVKAGEIVGISGLVGAGRTELARALSGADPITSGEVFLSGKKLKLGNIGTAMREGIIMLSEDRRKYGIVGCRDILDNATLSDNCVSKELFAGSKRQVEKAKELIKKLNVKTPGLSVKIENLSGGNQQKVVLAKWLMLDAKVLILDEPTRGIDVGAKYEIYKIIEDLAKLGCAIIMISSEIPELMGMTDRMYVMCKGRITGKLNREEFSQELTMKYAVGGTNK